MSNQWKMFVIAALLPLIGCSSEEASCTDVSVDGESYCVYQGAITETGYVCPQDRPNLFRDQETELVVCSPDNDRPPFDEVDAALQAPPDTNPTPNNTGAKHASCAEPVDDLSNYPLPNVNVGPDGSPAFLDYKDVDCDSLPDIICASDSDCPGGDFSECLKPPGAAEGVCTSFDIDIWCDGEGEAMGYGDGACWTCIPPESHAAACCAGLPGFDCRDAPLPARGPGSVCATHDHCEAGLVCGEHTGEGYGICQCPGLEPDNISPQDNCWD